MPYSSCKMVQAYVKLAHCSFWYGHPIVWDIVFKCKQFRNCNILLNNDRYLPKKVSQTHKINAQVYKSNSKIKGNAFRLPKDETCTSIALNAKVVSRAKYRRSIIDIKENSWVMCVISFWLVDSDSLRLCAFFVVAAMSWIFLPGQKTRQKRKKTESKINKMYKNART